MRRLLEALAQGWALLVGVLAYAAAHAEPETAVTSWARHFGGRVVYSYELRNASSWPVQRFWIGATAPGAGLEGKAELTVMPRSTGPGLWLSPDVSSSPEGWGASLSFDEESSRFSVEWIEGNHFRVLFPLATGPGVPVPKASGAAIAALSTRGGFSVTLPSDDPAYVRGHASIQAGPTWSTVQMVPGDREAPRIDLSVDRVNQNQGHGEWAIFSVRCFVSDNYDAQPLTEFSLVSTPAASEGDTIASRTSNAAWSVKVRNVRGRVYTFQVRAADASGNAATRYFTYAVPN